MLHTKHVDNCAPHKSIPQLKVNAHHSHRSMQVLAYDATNVEAIACIAAHHFYTDQPEVALRYYRRLLQVGEFCRSGAVQKTLRVNYPIPQKSSYSVEWHLGFGMH